MWQKDVFPSRIWGEDMSRKKQGQQVRIKTACRDAVENPGGGMLMSRFKACLVMLAVLAVIFACIPAGTAAAESSVTTLDTSFTDGRYVFAEIFYPVTGEMYKSVSVKDDAESGTADLHVFEMATNCKVILHYNAEHSAFELFAPDGDDDEDTKVEDLRRWGTDAGTDARAPKVGCDTSNYDESTKYWAIEYDSAANRHYLKT